MLKVLLPTLDLCPPGPWPLNHKLSYSTLFLQNPVLPSFCRLYLTWWFNCYLTLQIIDEGISPNTPVTSYLLFLFSLNSLVYLSTTTFINIITMWLFNLSSPLERCETGRALPDCARALRLQEMCRDHGDGPADQRSTSSPWAISPAQ